MDLIKVIKQGLQCVMKVDFYIILACILTIAICIFISRLVQFLKKLNKR